MDVNEAINAYVSVRADYDTANAVLKRMRKLKDEAERRLVEVFLEASTTSVKTEELTVSIKKSCNMSVTLGNQHQWVSWLMARGLDTSDYLREELVKKRLRETVREVLAKEGMLAMELPNGGLLPVDETPKVAIRGWQGFMRDRGVEVSDDDEAE